MGAGSVSQIFGHNYRFNEYQAVRKLLIGIVFAQLHIIRRGVFECD